MLRSVVAIGPLSAVLAASKGERMPCPGRTRFNFVPGWSQMIQLSRGWPWWHLGGLDQMRFDVIYHRIPEIMASPAERERPWLSKYDCQPCSRLELTVMHRREPFPGVYSARVVDISPILEAHCLVEASPPA
jgi:hypothetical protein